MYLVRSQVSLHRRREKGGRALCHRVCVWVLPKVPCEPRLAPRVAEGRSRDEGQVQTVEALKAVVRA